MEIKNSVTIEFKKGENNYLFVMPANAPLAEIYDIAFQVVNDMLKRMQEATASVTPKNPEEVEASVVNTPEANS